MSEINDVMCTAVSGAKHGLEQVMGAHAILEVNSQDLGLTGGALVFADDGIYILRVIVEECPSAD